MRPPLQTCLVVFALVFGCCVGPADAGARKRQPERVKDDPALPRVLLIGDSISMGYTAPVRKLLSGVADVRRIPVNGGPTSRGVKLMDRWLGKGDWDVIHFNFGLHDLKLIKGKHQVPLEQYDRNLRKMVKQMKACGAKLIWASTTPVPEGPVRPPRRNADVKAYNAVADKIAKDHGIQTNDLYGFAIERLDELQRPNNVHFTQAGSKALGKQVAASIRKALAE